MSKTIPRLIAYIVLLLTAMYLTKRWFDVEYYKLEILFTLYGTSFNIDTTATVDKYLRNNHKNRLNTDTEG